MLLFINHALIEKISLVVGIIGVFFMLFVDPDLLAKQRYTTHLKVDEPLCISLETVFVLKNLNLSFVRKFYVQLFIQSYAFL